MYYFDTYIYFFIFFLKSCLITINENVVNNMIKIINYQIKYKVKI
jgi:hypothetical protein